MSRAYDDPSEEQILAAISGAADQADEATAKDTSHNVPYVWHRAFLASMQEQGFRITYQEVIR